MLMANSAAIITDAFPAEQRGMALGINQIAAPRRAVHRPGRSAACSPPWDWRAVFWINVPVGIVGTIWAYRSAARDRRSGSAARIDWWGNLTFAVGAGLLLVSITYGIQPYGGHTMGWTSPWVLGGLVAGVAAAGRSSH